ncbi:MAG TPA: sigma-70 family RNA polymerase sigma factor [Acidimicrobiales bacterium]|jgi:RNA polymerase sigma factor (sigma-70 family)
MTRQLTDGEVEALEPLVRGIVRRRVRDEAAVDDLVQEAFVRLATARERLNGGALAPYAATVARTVVIEAARRRERLERHLPRMLDRVPPAEPEDLLLDAEERDAVEDALDHLPPADRAALVAHEVHGARLDALAATTATTPGATAARLARARARLRVEYLIALRRVDLPGDACRPVLVAISAGDRRRQRTLAAGDHLLSCPTCASLAPPLAERRRALTALLPFAVAAMGARRLVAKARAHPAATATGATAVAVAVTAAAVVAARPPETPPPAPVATATSTEPAEPGPTEPSRATTTPTADTAALTVDDRTLLDLAPDELAAFAGHRVEASGVQVLGVPADEGFWVGSGPDRRIWVALEGTGESPVEISPGQRLDFVGTLVANPPGYARSLGLSPADQAALTAAAHHVAVLFQAVTPSD